MTATSEAIKPHLSGCGSKSLASPSLRAETSLLPWVMMLDTGQTQDAEPLCITWAVSGSVMLTGSRLVYMDGGGKEIRSQNTEAVRRPSHPNTQGAKTSSHQNIEDIRRSRHQTAKVLGRSVTKISHDVKVC